MERLGAPAFRLGAVDVDLVRHTVTRDGELVPVEPRVMQLLAYLCDRPGKIVSKRELVEHVWRSHVVDEAVHRAMSLLRAALGDSPQHPTLIETIPRHGYRLLVRPTYASGDSAWPRVAAALALGAAALVAVLALVVPGQWAPRDGPQPVSRERLADQPAEPPATRRPVSTQSTGDGDRPPPEVTRQEPLARSASAVAKLAPAPAIIARAPVAPGGQPAQLPAGGDGTPRAEQPAPAPRPPEQPLARPPASGS